MAGEADIRAAFAQQAFYCDSLFAPLTGLVCALLGERLDRTTLIGRRVLAGQQWSDVDHGQRRGHGPTLTDRP